MTDLLQERPLTSVQELNQTPLSQSLKKMLTSPVEDRLYLSQVLEWATGNLAADAGWAAAVEAAVVLAEANDPEALYETLSSQRLEQATTMRQAGLAILSSVADLVRPGTQPA